MDEAYGDQSAFDMGISTLGRINYWIYQANNCNYNNDPPAYFNSLLVVYHELIPFIQKKLDRVEFHETLSSTCQKHLHKFINLKNNAQTLNKPFVPPRDVFDSLHRWDKELRIDLKKTGLLMREGERADTAML